MRRDDGIERSPLSGKVLSRRRFLRVGAAGLVGIAAVGPLWKRKNGYDGQRFEPPDGDAYTGVSVTRPPDFSVEAALQEWEDWLELVKLDAVAVSHEYTWFNTVGTYPYDFAEARGATPMISIEFTNAPTPEVAGTGRAVDGTFTDDLILRHLYNARQFADKVFIRLGHEMNGQWYPWCAYNADGSPRWNTTEDYRQAWRRFVIMSRGGRVGEINNKLSSYNLPPLDTRVEPTSNTDYPRLDEPNNYLQPADNVAYVWCPNSQTIPSVAGNAPINYYPGDEFVDWVGQDVYHQPWYTTIDSYIQEMNDHYDEFCVKRGKPYMLAEWGLRPASKAPDSWEGNNNDDPEFIRRILDWSARHPQVKALVYWSWNFPPEGDYRLENFPEAAAALAEGWHRERFLHSLR